MPKFLNNIEFYNKDGKLIDLQKITNIPISSADGLDSIETTTSGEPNYPNKTQGHRSFTIGQRNLNGGYQSFVSGEFNTIPIITEKDIEEFGDPDVPEDTYSTWACGDIFATGNGIVASGSGSVVGGNRNYSGSGNSLLVGTNNRDWINDDEKEYYDEYVSWKTTGETSSENVVICDFLNDTKLFRNTSTGNITGGNNNEVRGIHTITSGSNNFNNSNQSIVIGRNNTVNSDNIYDDVNTSCSAFIGSDILSTKGHHKILLGEGISSASYSNIFGFGKSLTFSRDYQILFGHTVSGGIDEIFKVGYNLTDNYANNYAIKTDINNNVFIQNKPTLNSDMPVRAIDLASYDYTVQLNAGPQSSTSKAPVRAADLNDYKFNADFSGNVKFNTAPTFMKGASLYGDVLINNGTNWNKSGTPVTTDSLLGGRSDINVKSIRIATAPSLNDQPYRKGDIFYDVSGNSTNSRYQAVDVAFKSIWIKNSTGAGQATNIADIYQTEEQVDLKDEKVLNDANSYTDDSIEALNYLESGSNTQTLLQISQTNGKISATYSDIAFPVTEVEGKTGAVELDKSASYTTKDSNANKLFTQNGAFNLYESARAYTRDSIDNLDIFDYITCYNGSFGFGIHVKNAKTNTYVPVPESHNPIEKAFVRLLLDGETGLTISQLSGVTVGSTAKLTTSRTTWDAVVSNHNGNMNVTTFFIPFVK